LQFPVASFLVVNQEIAASNRVIPEPSDAPRKPATKGARLAFRIFLLLGALSVAGVPLTASEVQIGLNFADSAPELFAGQEMGEDALRVLRACLKIRTGILADIAGELPHVRAAVKWAIHCQCNETPHVQTTSG
jgi:hypothetical protein